MTRPKSELRKNVPASFKAQLLRLARMRAEDFNSVLTRYVLERLLYRLSISEHANDFLLKGALLFHRMVPATSSRHQGHRAARLRRTQLGTARRRFS